MNTLIIVRHAKSGWDNPDLKDHERILTKRGKTDAPLMAVHLKHLLAQHNTPPEIIISSSAVRALDTARIFAKEFGIDEQAIDVRPELYLPDVSTLLDVVNTIDSRRKCVIIFSHNNGVTDFVNYLCGSDILNIPTCGIAIINTPVWNEVSQGNCTLAAFEYPRKIKGDV
ncbi:MAG: histidine phosphatase family protein [Candidatus Kapabacteria bacterium]|nr:histidine phosphatase family protein [Candidatus Kapabacteria bacterium]